LSDYKFTSVWTVIYGLKPEWKAQMNCYKPFYEAATFPVNEMKIYVLGRDWKRTDMLHNNNYPKHEISTLNVPVWNANEIETYMQARVRIHQNCEDIEDNKLPFCTPEERWEKKTTWAVIKEGRKRAERVLDSEQKAIEYINIAQDKKLAIIKRPGESTRCEHYCVCKEFCNQYQEIIKEEKHG
jgi:hypothetical protein